MTEKEILSIEEALAVSLPSDYRMLMLSDAAPSLGLAGLFNEPKIIIDRTKEQRQGYGGAPPWLPQFVYIGDQEDACPYALDCNSGAVKQTDHGNMTKKALACYESSKSLADELVADQEPAKDCGKRSGWMFWRT